MGPNSAQKLLQAKETINQMETTIRIGKKKFTNEGINL